MISYILYYTIVSVCTSICDGASVSDLEITYNYGVETNNWNNYRCSDMIWINENKTMDLIIKSNTKLFVAWCDDGEHQMQLEISKKNANYHNHNLAPEHLAYTKLYGNDVYEGEWNCTLLTKKGVPVDHLADKRNVYKHTDGENYLAIWCTISIAVRRSIKLWVYNDGKDLTDPMLLQSGGPSDTTYVYFRQGQHFVIKCQKDFEGDILKSGTLRNNICIEAEQCRISEQKNKSILQYISKNHNSYGKNIINSSCIYNSAKNVKTTSVVNFILINDKPPELFVVDDNVYIYNGVYYYEGKSGNTITIRCVNKETSGSLNSIFKECPEDKNGVCISSSLANKNVINKNITLTDGTQYKWECVYINEFKAETKSFMTIAVIRPPKITVKSSSQGLQTTTDMLGWRGRKENITIKCINQEKKGSIAWQYGNESGMKEKPEDNTNTILIYGLLAGGILIIAILILAMVRTCRKPADDQKRSSGHYENFTNERTPIQPFPGRANLEETYICPADCQEPTYAVSKNPGSTDTYAEPFKPKLEDLYSKPTPKKDRNNVNDLYSQITPKRKETVDEINYAEIDNVTVKGDSNVRGKNDKPVIYAEVSKYANLAQEVLDAKKKMDQKDEYSNVFTNERYCNSRNKSDDYAEPSYCEVNRK